jgi:hypothetical protein
MEVAVPFLIVLVVLFVVGGMVWHFSRARNILQRWAEANGYEILSSEIRWFRRGPFFWTTSKGQDVYYVTIRTPDGQIRNGWVRCGGWFLGLLSDKADVRWDE